MTFGEKLSRALDATGMTQVELARRMGVDPSAVTQWCRDAWPPTFGNLFKLAEALGTTPSRLLKDVEHTAA